MKNQVIELALRNTATRMALLNKIASFFNLNSINGILVIDSRLPSRLDVSIPNKTTIQFLKCIFEANDWKIEIIPKTY